METRAGRLAVLAYHSSPLSEPGSGDSGGMSVYVRETAARLAGLSVQTDIFTRAATDLPWVVELTPGVRVVGIKAGPGRPIPKEQLPAHLDEFSAGVRIFSMGQHVAYDVVHSHYWQSGVAAEKLANIWDVPLVHSNHTLGALKNRFLAPEDEPEPAGRIEAERRVMNRADVLIASTDQEYEQLACLYGAGHDRLKTIHPGVDHDLFSPGDTSTARRLLGLPKDRPSLVVVGRIQPLKGLGLAIEAVDHLRHALDRPPLLSIIGGASGRTGDDELRRLHRLVADRGVADLVRFVGPVPHADLPSYYRAADLTLVCSHYESFGLTALESQACGTPIIGTAVGALSFVVRDGRSGFLIPSRDPSDLAARAKTLLSDPDLARTFGVGSVASAERFSWDRTAGALSELYDCLMSERLPEACTC
ncbi:MAG: glycosyltransferase [Actinobacteria bacterium]|nr:glycosyltransferase [Actinomycetota bacterium]